MEAFLIAVGPLSIIVTKLVDVLRNAFDRTDPVTGAPRFPKVTWNFASFVIGVGVCLLWQADYHDLVPGLPPVLASLSGVQGQILTGLALGAVASGWHEVLDAISSTATEKRAEAGKVG